MTNEPQSFCIEHDATSNTIQTREDMCVLEASNAMPASTWIRLQMNDVCIELPVMAGAGSAASVSAQGVCYGDDGDFDRVLENAEQRYAHMRRKPALDHAAQAQQTTQSDKHSLDMPALSAYQEQALALEETYSPIKAFTTGMGKDAFDALRTMAAPAQTIRVATNTQAQVSIHVRGCCGEVRAAAADVVVEEGGALDLVIILDAAVSDVAQQKVSANQDICAASITQEPLTAHNTPATLKESAAGVVGSSVRLIAGAHSRVNLTCIQTADDAFVALDDSGLFLDEEASVHVRHLILGAGASYTGLAGELAGAGATVTVETSYLGVRNQKRDFNYCVTHRGRETKSELLANGVLAGASKKCLRGTIDLAHGCKGASGLEHETVLLVDEGVENKTVPVILCDEDDVVGNHGATIGHVRPDQLFYLQARGISPEAAEGLFVRAKLEEAALSAPNDAARAGVIRCGCMLFDDFLEALGVDHV